jgi:hypothetical protein
MELSEHEAEQVLRLIMSSPERGWYSPVLPEVHAPLCHRILDSFPNLKARYSGLTPEEQAKIVTPKNIKVGETYVVWYPYNAKHQLDARDGDKIAVYEGAYDDYEYGMQHSFCQVGTGMRFSKAEEDLPRLVRPYTGGKDAAASKDP